MSDNETVNVRYMVDDVATSIDFYTKLLDFEVLTNAAPAFETQEYFTADQLR